MIDGYNLGLEEGTGIATYARNLSYCLTNMGQKVDVLYGTKESRSNNQLLREISFFDPDTNKPNLWEKFSNNLYSLLTLKSKEARQIRISTSSAVINTHYKSRLPLADTFWNISELFNKSYQLFDYTGLFLTAKLSSAPEIAHWTYPLPIRIKGAKNIYTIHDLIPLRLPYTTLDSKRRYFNLMMSLAKKADHIVTVSETSKRDIINILGIPEERITNTYQSVNIPAEYANKPVAIVKKEVEGIFNLDYKEYMLFFSAIEPKKNVTRLMEAYLASNIATPLVIVGKKAWKLDPKKKNEKVSRYLNEIDSYLLNHHQKIHYINYTSFHLLVSLIKGAKAVLFPSLYEGFGLPALEAMQLGTPVLSSTEGSLPEICGEAALLVNPYDVRALSEGIIYIDTDDNLRRELSIKGIKQAAKFSEAAYCIRLKKMYEQFKSTSI
ncbi:MAG: glycosyltransferase [Legionella sp.]|nr:glycosyltransferase [Legionella sp.]